VRNSLFRRCGYFGILAGNGSFAGGAPGVSDLVLENNVFERTLCWANAGGCPPSGDEDSNPDTGAAPYSLMFGADPFVRVTIRNNLFESTPSVEKPSYTDARFVGNVGVHGRCVSGFDYRHNVFTGRRCGPRDRAARGVLSGYDGNWRLTDPGSAAVGAADPRDAPAGDRQGQRRDGDPDAGPDELSGALAERGGGRPVHGLRVRRTRRGIALRLRFSRPGRVSGWLDRRRGNRFVHVRRLRVRRGAAGPAQVRLGRLRPGRYRVRLVAVARGGARSRTVLRFGVPSCRRRAANCPASST
jgi:hypothetical protein